MRRKKETNSTSKTCTYTKNRENVTGSQETRARTVGNAHGCAIIDGGVLVQAGHGSDPLNVVAETAVLERESTP